MIPRKLETHDPRFYVTLLGSHTEIAQIQLPPPVLTPGQGLIRANKFVESDIELLTHMIKDVWTTEGRQL